MSEPIHLVDFIKLNADTQFSINGVADVVWTHAIYLPRNASFALELQFSGAAVKVKVEAEHANQVPATEKATDANYVKPVFTNGGDASLISSEIADTSVHVINIRPTPTKYVRFKLTGNTGNGADTKLTKAKLTYVR